MDIIIIVIIKLATWGGGGVARVSQPNLVPVTRPGKWRGWYQEGHLAIKMFAKSVLVVQRTLARSIDPT